MPKSTDLTVANNTTDTAAPGPEGHSHNTRGIIKKYSHYRLPYTPVPPRNTNRPPLPPLAARRRGATEKTAAPTTLPNENMVAGGNGTSADLTSISAQAPLNPPLPTNENSTGSESTTDTENQVGTRTILNHLVPSGLTTVDEESGNTTSHNAGQSSDAALAQTNDSNHTRISGIPQTVTVQFEGVTSTSLHPSTHPSQTPGRPSRIAIWSTPVSVQLHTAASNRENFTFDDEHNPFGGLRVNSRPLFQSELQFQVAMDSSTNSTGSSGATLLSEHPGSGPSEASNYSENSTGLQVTPRTTTNPAQPVPPNTSYTALRSAIANLIPAHPMTRKHQVASGPVTFAPIDPSPSLGGSVFINQTTGALQASNGIPMLPNATTGVIHQMSVLNSNPAPGASSSTMTIPTLAPGFPLPGYTAPGSVYFGHQTVNNPRQHLRQSNFNYDQVVCIHLMTKFWNFYLITEDAFPINLIPVRQAAIAYVAGILQDPNAGLGISLQMFDFVRKKDSNLRGHFSNGLLSAIETHYSVNRGSKSKIAELINNRNFLYVEYDPNDTRTVSGRYRHPALVAVAVNLLFNESANSRPAGVRFMSRLIEDTPPQGLQEFTDKTAKSGAPVPLLALACTLVLYGLHSLQAGDGSDRVKSRKAAKPVSFTGAKYAATYRGYVARLKAYHRLGELWKFYMEAIMRAFIGRQNDCGDSDVEDVEDDERYSDGE